MAWQRSHRYYYRSERQGSRVRSVYLGCGADAALLAELEVLRQAETREARAAWHQAREHAAQEDAALATMDLVIETLAAACLSAAGYHRHHQGTWRKRRGTAENPPRTA